MKKGVYKILESFGLSTSWICTFHQTQETLQTIQLIITIIATVVSIVLALISFFKNAKANDGKITADEIVEGGKILQEGIEEIKNNIKGEEEK